MASSKDQLDQIRVDIGAAMIMALHDHDYAAIDANLLAQHSGHDVAVVRRLFPDMMMAADQGLRDLDDKVMAQLAEDFAEDQDASPREKILEGLIARYEAYAPHKAVIKALNKASVLNPLLATMMVTRLNIASKTLLNLAGVDTSGLMGMLQVKGLSGVALSCQREWFQDDTADLAVTIRTLDQRLKQAESLASTLMIIPKPTTDKTEGHD